MPRRFRLLVGAALLAATVTVPAVAAAPTYPEPILTSDRTGDPSVVETLNGRVMVATGPLVRRARWDPGEGWRWIDPALARLPRWAAPRGDVWAPDLARFGDQWVLYYSAPVRGLGPTGRCIGMATAPTAYDTFRPIDARPLVCFPRADTPPAYDQVPAKGGLPRRGLLDPSVFVDDDEAPYLLYKTDGRPSSIRLLPLAPRGLGPAEGAVSTELVRADWVMENPVVLRRGDYYHLFTAEDLWSKCSYRTVWRRSTDLTVWPLRPRRVLLSRSTTGGLCGPGGADVLVARDAPDRPLLYFHGWVLDRNLTPPDPPFVAGPPGRRAHRVLYGARLRFVDDVPSIVGYLAR
ncbi:family 43 glycosylhydrolase [Nocardioides humilatus]|uniref:Family 43 glycosylhydrolase n=1 Tax=Nocardioides humilatus TaxID=2607660 RepID=A0A5B1LM67_9ACTN|nr:family 43 glycosylhydrolase [Nocardioides humilatus]KAA1421643.1 family 43 glycosylhydrolase [Nocardioides humilatus]